MSALLAAVARRWLALTLAVVALVTLLSLWPDPGVQKATPGSDKLHHVLAYAAMALPLALARPRLWLAGLAGLAAWSWGIELLQPLVGRDRALADLAANLAGMALGVAAASLLRRLAAARLRADAPPGAAGPGSGRTP